MQESKAAMQPAVACNSENVALQCQVDGGLECSQTHVCLQVSQAAQESTNRVRTAYQGLKLPSTEWDGKAWIRFIARLGLFGAAL